MKEILTGLLNYLGLAYWVKIDTADPTCTYYFGPFLSLTEAKKAKAGYIEDLMNENSSGIEVEIKRCKPSELTVFNEKLEESGDLDSVSVYMAPS